MNLNQKLAPILADGIPGYNKKINEIEVAVNWLLGMRTSNGPPITESDQGPIINLSQGPAATGTQPWLTDPDGNPAGWLKVLVLNPNQNSPPGLTCWEQWIWTSNSLATTGLPWLVDPNGSAAHWLMGANGGVWGTGMYPTGVAGNFVPGYSVYSGAKDSSGNPGYISPWNYTINPSGGNIANLPTNPPAFYIKSSGNVNGPVILVGGGPTESLPNDTVDWNLNVVYDGTTVLGYSGSTTVSAPAGYASVTLDPTGWIFDPTGLVGYAHGSGLWIWEYPDSISTNHNPTINQNFVFSSDSGRGFVTAFTGGGTGGYVYLTV